MTGKFKNLYLQGSQHRSESPSSSLKGSGHPRPRTEGFEMWIKGGTVVHRREGFPGVLKHRGFIYTSSQHTPDQLIPLHISLTPLVSCPKVGTFGYQDHQEKRYSTSDSGSQLRRLVDGQSQRPSSHGTTSPPARSQKILTQAQRPPPRSSPEDSWEP